MHTLKYLGLTVRSLFLSMFASYLNRCLERKQQIIHNHFVLEIDLVSTQNEKKIMLKLILTNKIWSLRYRLTLWSNHCFVHYLAWAKNPIGFLRNRISEHQCEIRMRILYLLFYSFQFFFYHRPWEPQQRAPKSRKASFSFFSFLTKSFDFC